MRNIVHRRRRPASLPPPGKEAIKAACRGPATAPAAVAPGSVWQPRQRRAKGIGPLLPLPRPPGIPRNAKSIPMLVRNEHHPFDDLTAVGAVRPQPDANIGENRTFETLLLGLRPTSRIPLRGPYCTGKALAAGVPATATGCRLVYAVFRSLVLPYAIKTASNMRGCAEGGRVRRHGYGGRGRHEACQVAKEPHAGGWREAGSMSRPRIVLQVGKRERALKWTDIGSMSRPRIVLQRGGVPDLRRGVMRPRAEQAGGRSRNSRCFQARKLVRMGETRMQDQRCAWVHCRGHACQPMCRRSQFGTTAAVAAQRAKMRLLDAGALAEAAAQGGPQTGGG